jgi:hypothetical protein
LLDLDGALEDMGRGALLDRYATVTRQGIVIDLPGAQNRLLIEDFDNLDALARSIWIL